MYNSDKEKDLLGCFVGIVILIFSLWLSGWTFEICLNFFLNKDIPFWADILAGIFASPITVPLGFILWIVSLF